MDEELIRVCALVARAASRRNTGRHLKALRDSVDQACCLPGRFDWDQQATAHAQIVGLLAETSGDPVLAVLAGAVPGWLHDLMVTVGPAAREVITASRRRLLVLVHAGDGDGAAAEMERHLRGLLLMRVQLIAG